MQIGEEVDDVECALNQVAQIVGGERHGFGRALLAVGDQVANDRQPPHEREVEQPEIAVERLDLTPVPSDRGAARASSGSGARPRPRRVFRGWGFPERRPRESGPAGARRGIRDRPGRAPRAGRPDRGRAAPGRSLGRVRPRCAGRPSDGGRSIRVSGPGAARTRRCCD